MNKQLQDFARARLKDMLAQLGDGEHRIFKLMYARRGAICSAEEREAVPIETVVDEMEPATLDWAMQQCSNTLKKYADLSARQKEGGNG